MSFDDYFFTRPSFVGGIARAIDLGGGLGQAAVLIYATPKEADEKALASDFGVIGKDIRSAVESIAPEAK